MSATDEKNWSVAAHVGPLLIGLLAPLLVLLIKGEQSARVRANAVEALNFQISYLIYTTVSFVLCLVLIGFLLLPVTWVAWFVFQIVAAVKVSANESYRYPLIFRLVS